MAMLINPEPLPVSEPNLFTASEKVVGNMTELNRPTRTADHMATAPVEKIVVSTSRHATIAAIPSNLPPGTFCRIAVPRNRPTIMPPQ
jgi:hypothetical protein